MHSTNNLEDGYLGSGQRLWKSINKYGKENHSIEILEFLPDREALKKREVEIITEDILKDPNCMNLVLGGEGGFHSEQQKQNFHKAGGRAFAKRIKEDSIFKEKVSEIGRKNMEALRKNGKVNYANWKGRSHTEDSKKKIGEANSIKQKGSNNSQFGTVWITNGTENKKIQKNAIIPSDWYKGRIIK